MTIWAAQNSAAAREGAQRAAHWIAARASVTAAAGLALVALTGCAAQLGAPSDTRGISTATAAPAGGAVNQRALAGWNGDISTPGLTAAHRSLPIGSYARVTNLGTGQSTVVQITSFLPAGRDRDIDLSRDAAAAIGALQNGVAAVTIAPTGGAPGGFVGAGEPFVFGGGEPRSASSANVGGYDPNISTASIPNFDTLNSEFASPARAGLTGARYLQLGSFQDLQNARRLAQRLQAQGLAGGAYGQPSIESAYVDGRLFHRVRVGPITDAEMAAQALSDARQLGHPQARILTP